MAESHVAIIDSSLKQPLSLLAENSVVLSSGGKDWQGLLLEQWQLEPGEYPLAVFSQYSLSLQLSTPIDAEVWERGRWQVQKATPGNIAVFDAGTVRGWRISGRYEPIILTLDTALVGRMAREVGTGEQPELISRYENEDQKAARIALTLRDELAEGCPGGRLFGEGLATALAVHLLTRYAVHPAKLKEYVRGLGQSDLSRVLDFIGDCLADDLSLDDLAATVALSPYHFSRLFKQSTGQSPHQYVLARRVEKAKDLLRAGRLTVGEVAQAVGFYDHAHFIRHFKKATGLTPRAYREGR